MGAPHSRVHRRRDVETYDVIMIGSGPAGLRTLILGKEGLGGYVTDIKTG